MVLTHDIIFFHMILFLHYIILNILLVDTCNLEKALNIQTFISGLTNLSLDFKHNKL